ncbi:GNAT family N-acetyltransferase [Streptomyces caniferus]|uniref:GNAT family N-acetyltransferase n=1 Tax=Streptomyces caniferus TaxID=285557 RepID=UPI002E2D044A|nr:GNAT family protein [Streptomyces caniferus]
MQGRLVTLEWPGDDDWAAIASWLRPGSPAAVLSGDWELLGAAEVEQANRSGRVHHLVIRTKDGEGIGTVSYQRSGRIGGFTVGGAIGSPELWRRGYGAEAVVLLVDYLFHQLDAHRVQVTTAGYNKGIIRLMTKTRFVVEGILRDHCYLDGAYHDSIVWGLLRDEHYASLQPSADNRVLAVGLADFVDEDDKLQARAILAEHLVTTRRTALAGFLDDEAAAGHDEAAPGRGDGPHDAVAATGSVPVPGPVPAAAPAGGAL